MNMIITKADREEILLLLDEKASKTGLNKLFLKVCKWINIYFIKGVREAIGQSLKATGF